MKAEIINSYVDFNFPFSIIQTSLQLKQASFQEYIDSVFRTSLPQYHALNSIFTNQQCLSIYIDLRRRNQKLKQLLLKNLSYPLILLIVSLLMLNFFDRFLIPQIQAMLVTFAIDSLTFRILAIFLNTLVILVDVSAGVLCLLSALLLSKPLRIIFFIKVHQHPRFRVFSLYLSYVYACYFYEFCSKGCSTMQFAKTIRKASINSYVRWVSYHVEKGLDEGKSFEDALNISYFDPLFVLFVKSAIKTNSIEAQLQNYMTMTYQVIQERLIKFSLVIKLISYSFVSVLIIVVYQVMTIPMQIMEKL